MGVLVESVKESWYSEMSSSTSCVVLVAAIKLLMVFEIMALKPTISPDKIDKFSAIDAMKEAVFLQGQEPEFPKS